MEILTPGVTLLVKSIALSFIIWSYNLIESIECSIFLCLDNILCRIRFQKYNLKELQIDQNSTSFLLPFVCCIDDQVLF